jgi:NADH-quinone oxidoreductase subunit G
VDRGYGSEIATFGEEGVHSLISGNLMDVCPVGAITTRDYRFKSRPWDNPHVVDTVCTLCSKGCNTNAWIKAKPEWAKGSRLIRMTPRFNADVNGYWMCDIGRFQYHWVEGETRLRKPLQRRGSELEAAAWHDVEPRLRDALQAAGSGGPGVGAFPRFRHASTEEFFVLKQLVEGLLGNDGLQAVTVSWTRSEKRQPAETKFPVPPTDAPNVNGAHDLGYQVGAGNDGSPTWPACAPRWKEAASKRCTCWTPGRTVRSATCRGSSQRGAAGTLPLLVVQGVLMTELVHAADFVLPGAAYVEKDAIYTNDRGTCRLSRVPIAPPGEAKEDWQILVNVAAILGLTLPYVALMMCGAR